MSSRLSSTGGSDNPSTSSRQSTPGQWWHLVPWDLVPEAAYHIQGRGPQKDSGDSDILEDEDTKNRHSKGDKASLMANRYTSEAILKDKSAPIRYQGDLLAHKSYKGDLLEGR